MYVHPLEYVCMLTLFTIVNDVQQWLSRNNPVSQKKPDESHHLAQIFSTKWNVFNSLFSQWLSIVFQAYINIIKVSSTMNMCINQSIVPYLEVDFTLCVIMSNFGNENKLCMQYGLNTIKVAAILVQAAMPTYIKLIKHT